MEGQGLRAPQEGPVRELVDEDGAPSDRPGWAAPVEFSLPGLGRPLPQTGAHTLAQSLGDLFQLLDVAPEVTFNALAGQVVTSVECQHRLQLGITLLQLLLLSLRDRGHFCNFMELLQTITPLAGGTQKQGAGIRQRDLLPLPIPAFGALLNLVKKHKRPGSGVIIWRVAEARKVGKQQLKKSVSAACFQTWRLLSVITLNGMGTGWEKLAPASGHVVTRSQTLALESLARRCAWWSGSPLEERPPGDFSDLIRSRQVDYTGDAVLKALPLRLEELAPGLPEDGVAGSLDASSIADETVKCWVDDPDVALLDPSAWPHPLPSASMNVSVSEWERIVAVLYNKGIVAPIEAEEIFHVNGVPVLNGVFAVEKGGEPLPGECRVTRLIMNLVPANSLQKLMPGDLPTLAGSSNWSGIHLLPNEVLLWSGDDQKGAFYAWKLPKAWRKLMAFKMPVPGRLVGRPDIPYIHVASAVIPMGWVNAVSLFQHLHRRAGLAAEPVGAGLDPSNEWRRDKPIPRGAVDAGGMWFQYYLDDFDCPEKVAKHTWKTMVNTMSPTQAKQRLSYDRIGIGISEKKAHVREPCVVRMGAEVDGVAGLLSAPRLKILETGWLLVWALGRPVLSARMKMVLLGRLTRCFEFRRPLMCLLNKCWPKSMWCRATPLPSGHAFELITAGALLCLAVMDLRTPVSGLVTCSDASTMGGGMCVSAGLTDAGEKLLMKLDAAPFDTECMKPQGSIQQPSRGGPRVLVLSLFDGVSAVMCGLTRLPCAVQGYAMSADDPDELRLSRTRFPGVIQLGKPQKVDAEIISKLLTSVGNRLDFVLLSAAATRSFFASDVSDPFFEICRIFDLLQHLSLVPVHLMVENLGNIPSRDVDAFNKALGCKPYLVDSKYFTWVERPRLFWISWDVHPLPGEVLVDRETHYEWRFSVQRSPQSSWVDAKSSWATFVGDLIPVFTRPRPRRRRPSGSVSDADVEAIARWEADSYRFDVECYQEQCLITCEDGSLRLPTLTEREKLMGFDDNYISQGLHPKHKGVERQRLGEYIIGGTYCVFSVMVVLDELLCSVGGDRTRQNPGFFTRGVAPACWTERPNFVKQTGPSSEVQRLVTHFLRIAEKGGTDVRLDAGIPFRAKAWPRSGVQSQLFKWAIVHGYPWRHVAHINVLELQAVVNSVKWRMRHADNLNHRAMLLIDSQVVCAIVAKGRTSSHRLQHSLMVLNALCLAANLVLTVAYVDTGNNPSDIPSRWSEDVRSERAHN